MIYQSMMADIQKPRKEHKFRDLNVPEDNVECESFTVISIGYLLVYESKY